MMKFSYRVGVVLLLCVVTVGWLIIQGYEYINYRDIQYPLSDIRLISANKVESPKSKKASWSLGNLSTKDNQNKIFLYKESECPWMNNSGATTDICTCQLLKAVDKDMRDNGEAYRFSNRYNGGPVNQNGAILDVNPRPREDGKTFKVILMPHSHNDPGWHKTLEGYFDDQTHPTLDNMIEKMEKFPEMTFIWAESVFLELWWRGLSPEKKDRARKLMSSGRIEVAVGSWVVPDEANTHYFALLDQMIEGHQWLETELNIKPNNTWSLDPFGYSSALSYLYQRAGYDNMVILRVNRHVKRILEQKKALEFFWQQPWDSDGTTKIFTLMMPYMLYNIKHTCGPDTSVCLQFDFRRIPGEMSESRAQPITKANVDRLAKALLIQYQKKVSLYKHNVVLIPLGDDFRYDRPIEWDQQYKNYMYLFNYINSKTEWNVEARFGTLTDYFNEVKMSMNASEFPSLSGDFFPYTDEREEYWTGYFTSRPYEKLLGREVEHFLRAADIIHSMVSVTKAISLDEKRKLMLENSKSLEEAHRNLGLFQHHDAVTGTARSYVVVDYEERLWHSIQAAKDTIQRSMELLMSKTGNNSLGLKLEVDDPFISKKSENGVVLKIPAGGRKVILYNSVGHRRYDLIRIIVDTDQVKVKDDNGKEILSQVNPVWESDGFADSKYELVFYADLAPLSLRTYDLSKSDNPEASRNFAAETVIYNGNGLVIPSNKRFKVFPDNGDVNTIMLENDKFRVRFSKRSGLMQSITTKEKIQTTKLNLEYLMYRSSGSGAYIFKPAGPAVDTEMDARPLIRVIRGPLLSEFHMEQQLVKSIIRVHNTSRLIGNLLEVENVVDIRSKNDKELVMRMTTDIDSNNTFHTDMNGLYMVDRERLSHFPTEANFYPMTAMAYIEDCDSRLSLLSRQPLGVSSLEAGQLEVMLDRRLTYDDRRGLGEGVLDNYLAPSHFYILLERKLQGCSSRQSQSKPLVKPKLSYPSLLAHTLSNYLQHPVIYVFTKDSTVLNYDLGLSRTSLPHSIILINVRPRISKAGLALIFQKVGYDCGFPFYIEENKNMISMQDIFGENKHEMTDIREMSLSLMHEKKELKLDEPLSILPMELKTYRVCFQ